MRTDSADVVLCAFLPFSQKKKERPNVLCLDQCYNVDVLNILKQKLIRCVNFVMDSCAN